jgi:hypothetical protein
MSVIKSLFITCVESGYDADYIMDVFYNSNIASVSRVTLLPIKSTGGDYNRVYLDISYWHDNEMAYNFIKRLKNPNVETHIIHSDDFWWNVKINKKQEITHSKKYNDYTRVNYLLEKDEDVYDYKLIYYNSNDDIQQPFEVKTNAAGAKLLAYIMNNGSISEKLNPVSQPIHYMNDEELEWFELQKEINSMKMLLQRQEYEY